LGSFQESIWNFSQKGLGRGAARRVTKKNDERDPLRPKSLGHLKRFDPPKNEKLSGVLNTQDKDGLLSDDAATR